MKGPHLPSSVLLLAAILPVALSSQSTFRYPLDSEVNLSYKGYEFGWPVKRVAVIGAGVGGIIAYRELKQDGFDVHIFERDSLPGGVWHYTEEAPLSPPIPNAPIAVADFEPSLPPQDAPLPYVEEYDNRTLCALQRRLHRAPKPVWYGLKTNAPVPIQEIRGFPWPDGTEWAVPQAKVARYLRTFASWHGVNTNDNSPDVSYNTRVELIQKHLDSSGNQIGWTLTTRQIEVIEDGLNRVTWNKQDFDAVVIATGRYNGPNIPRIAGLEEWAKQFPEDILHSRQYRHPEEYAGKTILIVGAAASGSQISREVSTHAAKIYQSVRPEKVPQRPSLIDFIRQIPQNVSIVAEIKRFYSPSATIQESRIELVDGTILSGIDHVLFATGFRYSYPFLPEYHNPALGRTDEAPPDAGVKPIITDGSHLRSLHLDTFYIDNPTLAFVNSNMGISTFTYAEFQSLAISMVWAEKAHLPTREEMWKLYNKRVEEVGYGKHFSFLGKREDGMVRFFRGWLNAAADKYGGRQINGLPFELSQILPLWYRALYGDPWLVRNVTIPGAENMYADFPMTIDEADMYDAVYNDYW
ncbi:hypothetical protein D9756_010063 [Leucocoprinus leucothites]|uniref:Flavin-containing monooxygenase n=1 Tax=Leucocoprinus leucothites TaxID=201217 RepID=A0A8H5CSX3_9AGAR|nr:hypothetical protein D9756_010063 [Leucoagaricus leucothites]